MMISPETFYDEVRDKSVEEIQKEIRSLKRSITRTKTEIERPDGKPECICPSRSTQIYWTREYLAMAKKALAEAGGEYRETRQEKEARLFLEDLPSLRRMELEIGGFYGDREDCVIEIEGDFVKGVEENKTKAELLEYLRDMHLEEWRKDYSPERYGIHVLDGTQWGLKLEYENRKSREYDGDNVYPWNFEELCALFGVKWERDYAIEEE